MSDENILNEEDLRFLKAYLDTEEKIKQFLITYMYILSPGMADGITESQIIERTILESDLINENLIGDVFTFIKGKNAISKYYKGLDSAAKNYISAAKQIDNLDRDKRGDKRKSELDKYESTVKKLEDVKKNIDKLKKDSKILSKYDSYSNNKYKIKLFLTGRKAGVSLSKLKGYEDDIDAIKQNQTTLKQDIEQAEKEAKEAEENQKPKETPDTNSPDDTEKTIDTKKENIQKELDKLKEKKNKIKKNTIILKNKLKNGESLTDEDRSKQIDYANSISKIEDQIVKLEKNLKENSTLSLSFFMDLHTLNEDITCLENSIGENL